MIGARRDQATRGLSHGDRWTGQPKRRCRQSPTERMFPSESPKILTMNTWPALLAARLAARKETANIAVGNMGISGNRVLTLSAGPSAVARFDRDVLSQSGVKWVMLMDGINDIGTGRPTEPVTLQQLTGAYKQIIEQAHTHGIQVIGCTLTPFLGAPYKREEGEPLRVAVNTWIRTSGAFDEIGR